VAVIAAAGVAGSGRYLLAYAAQDRGHAGECLGVRKDSGAASITPVAPLRTKHLLASFRR